METDKRIDMSDLGRPYGDLNRRWTIGELKEIASRQGKPFKPAEDIKEQLANDLSEGALVLFNENEVIVAIERGLVPRAWKEGLADLVTVKNDIAIIPSGAVAQWEKEQQKLAKLRQALGGRF